MIRTETIQQEAVDFMPYKRLAQAIILRAIKDYSREEYPFSIRRWVKWKLGTFDLCAAAWDRSPKELQKIMTRKMDAIDRGESLKLNWRRSKLTFDNS